jgi:hypothetical protein
VSKPHLVVSRVGDGSLHREWLGDPAHRTYDVWLDYYGDDDTRFAGDAAVVSTGRNTTKWKRMAALLTERAADVAKYEAVWFPDDDLSVAPAGVEGIFALFRRLRLDLAQPALLDGSYSSFYITLRHRTLLARFTNFVEGMAPMFSPRALAACRGTFESTISNWGVDFLWPKLLGYPEDRIAILDGTPVLHTRPVGSGAWYRSLGVDPRQEMAELLSRHGVRLPYPFRQFGGIPARAREDVAVSGLPFFLRAAIGAPCSVLRHRLYWRALRASILE